MSSSVERTFYSYEFQAVRSQGVLCLRFTGLYNFNGHLTVDANHHRRFALAAVHFDRAALLGTHQPETARGTSDDYLITRFLFSHLQNKP